MGGGRGKRKETETNRERREWEKSNKEKIQKVVVESYERGKKVKEKEETREKGA